MNSAFINYVFRSVFVIIGALILFGVIEVSPYESEQANTNVRIAGGLILILFGIYRIALYKIKSKRYEFEANVDKDSNS
ncbi:MAG: hypothetical protein Kapaf2KO_08200 [Candidatus Kapaibacteriales bacterium]